MKNKEVAIQDAYFFRGTSMAHTFRNGDYIFFQKASVSELKYGDAIVFDCQNSEEIKKQCVHRIIGKSNKNLITRGDNNPKNDEEPVTEENLIGKVTHYERNGKIHKVWNGRLGLMRARVLHGRLYTIKAAKYFLRKPYRLLKKTGIVSKFWRPEIETIYFETQDGPLVKYVHKGRTVASCWLDNNRWWFRRPYDFVIGPKVK
jgi:signal peptidase I